MRYYFINARTNAGRYFTYNITTGALGVAFIILLLYLINTRALLPGIVILGSFILFVLWLVGLIVVSLELWGPQGNVNGNCALYVGSQESRGQSLETLAWLMQNNICEYFTQENKRYNRLIVCQVNAGRRRGRSC